MERVDVVAAAEAALRRPLDEPVTVHRSGTGYSWHTHIVRAASGTAAVVRVAPAGGTLDPYDVTREQRALDAAAGSVPAPTVLLAESDPSRFGAPLLVQTLSPGEVLQLSAIDGEEARRSYRAAFSAALGSLHRKGDARVLDTPATVTDALVDEIDRVESHYLRSARCRHPGFEIGLRWLRHHLPEDSSPPVVCHGDFRFSNMTWTGVGILGAVLDWERAWPGDPMADVAFTRHFSGWCSVAGDGVAAYEASSGILVNEQRVAYCSRLERVRSYSAALRGLAAVADGRRDEPILAAIGEAGWNGTWGLVDWLAPDLPPLGEIAGDASYVPPIPAERLAELARSVAPEDPLGRHLADWVAADAVARGHSLVALAELGDTGWLAGALAGPDPERAWSGAYSGLTRAASHGGPELLPALRALGLRFTSRSQYLAEMQWD